jgi:hypothetical protein
MSKIISLIQEHFPEDSFSASDFGYATEIDCKVAAMGLSKLANSHRIGRFTSFNGGTTFYYMSIEECNQKREEANKFIKKHGLKQKLFKLL